MASGEESEEAFILIAQTLTRAFGEVGGSPASVEPITGLACGVLTVADLLGPIRKTSACTSSHGF
jgi:hypothetical protein